jgi:hypothetical protein
VSELPNIYDPETLEHNVLRALIITPFVATLDQAREAGFIDERTTEDMLMMFETHLEGVLEGYVTELKEQG